MAADGRHNGGPPIDDDRRGDGGWVAIARTIRSHWLVGFGQPVKPSDPSRGAHSRSEAFIDLIMECRYEAGTVNNGGRKMVIQPGQLIGAVSWLAHRWNWSPMTVRTYLDKLENDGMIERATPGTAENNMQRGKQAAVITVCNYSDYQVSRGAVQHEQKQANNTQAASKQQASNNTNKEEQGNKGTKDSPLPPSGGAPAELFVPTAEPPSRGARAAASRAANAQQQQVADSARDAYNARASRQGWAVCETLTTARRQRLTKRIAEVGGLDRFVAALDAVNRDDFLSGRVPPKDGRPFRLDIDRLLSTGSGLGDVLARLLDSAGTAEADPAAVNGMSWGWWRGKEATLRAYPLERWEAAVVAARPNGTWPWWILGAPPGHAECLVPERLVEKYGYREIYQGSITHV